MICKPCRTGADLPATGGPTILVKKNWHSQCKGGTHCTCQHRVGRKNIQ
jgi:hypothetical protein